MPDPAPVQKTFKEMLEDQIAFNLRQNIKYQRMIELLIEFPEIEEFIRLQQENV